MTSAETTLELRGDGSDAPWRLQDHDDDGPNGLDDDLEEDDDEQGDDEDDEDDDDLESWDDDPEDDSEE